MAGANLAYRGFGDSLRSIDGFSVCLVLTRWMFDSCKGHPHHEDITNCLDEPIYQAVVAFEYAASSLGATYVVYAARRILYTNITFCATSGSFFVDRGLDSEPLLGEMVYWVAFDEKMASGVVPANYSRQSEALREL